MVGFVVIVALALTLLWRVYVHHSTTQPLDDEDETVIAIAHPHASAFPQTRSVKISAELR